jgi:hypothetical protein
MISQRAVSRIMLNRVASFLRLPEMNHLFLVPRLQLRSVDNCRRPEITLG